MGKNRVFFPQEALDRWLREGQVELSGAELTIRARRRRYRLVEAVRVVAEVSNQPDPHELVGRVKTVAFLTELGAELLGGSMVIGDNAYETVPGWSTPTKGVTRFDALPKEAQRYIRRLEETSGVACAIISTGSDRSETIVRSDSVVAGWVN